MRETAKRAPSFMTWNETLAWGVRAHVRSSQQLQFLGVDQSWLAAKDEFKKLQGKWKAQKGTPSDAIIVYDRMLNETVLRIDPGKTPKEIDYNSSRGANLATSTSWRATF